MELRIISNPIEPAGPVRWLLSNLFYGCGYNFYRGGNRVGVDDLLIRSKLSELLEESRGHLRALAAAFRHRSVPPSGRQGSLGNPAAAATAEALERAQGHLAAMEAAVRTPSRGQRGGLPPCQAWERGRLERLVALDGEAVLALVRLRDAIARADDGAAAGMEEELRASGFDALWRRREALLAGD